MENVIVYIDGFNLYFGLRSKEWKRYLWLNLVSLSSNILKPGQNLVLTKYFTAKIKIPPEKSQRQRAYIEALETLDQIEIFYGKYQSNKVECNKCGNIMLKPNEKMTDVNIAVEMLNDAFFNRFETAILVSADSDLSAPVKTIKKNFPNKRIVCAFPPKRFYYELSVISDAHFIIGRKKFKDSLFPDEVEKPDGFKLKKPITWI